MSLVWELKSRPDLSVQCCAANKLFMIFGIGADLVKVKRIKKIYNKHQDKFATKILSCAEKKEFTQALDKASFLAKRFAAKEAFAKALGTGMKGFWFNDIEIIHDAHGKPGFKFYGRLKSKVLTSKIKNQHLSITDEKNYALAYVVLEV